MSFLNKLKIVAQPTTQKVSAEIHRRNKVVEKLEEQLLMLEAEAKGETYQRLKFAWVTDGNGDRTRIQRPAKLRKWWSKDAAGNIVLSVRYGSTPLELQKGKTAIEVGKLEALPAAIKMLMQAINAGELDDELKKATGKRSPAPKQAAA